MWFIDLFKKDKVEEQEKPTEALNDKLDEEQTPVEFLDIASTSLDFYLNAIPECDVVENQQGKTTILDSEDVRTTIASIYRIAIADRGNPDDHFRLADLVHDLGVSAHEDEKATKYFNESIQTLRAIKTAPLSLDAQYLLAYNYFELYKRTDSSFNTAQEYTYLNQAFEESKPLIEELEDLSNEQIHYLGKIRIELADLDAPQIYLDEKIKLLRTGIELLEIAVENEGDHHDYHELANGQDLLSEVCYDPEEKKALRCAALQNFMTSYEMEKDPNTLDRIDELREEIE